MPELVNASTKPKCKNWPRQLQKVPGARHGPPKKFENTDKAHDIVYLLLEIRSPESIGVTIIEILTTSLIV